MSTKRRANGPLRVEKPKPRAKPKPRKGARRTPDKAWSAATDYPDPDDLDDVLTFAEVAAILKVHKNFVGKLVKDGRLATLKVGFGRTRPRQRVLRAELARFIMEGESFTEPEEDPGSPSARRRRGKLPPITEWYV